MNKEVNDAGVRYVVTVTRGVTSYAWDKDRRLDSVSWADGTGVDLVQFASGSAEAGKLYQLKTLTGAVLSTYGYDAGSGQLSTIATSQNVTTSLGWDGRALTSVGTSWSGSSQTVSQGLGDYLRVHTESVTGGNTATYEYDATG